MRLHHPILLVTLAMFALFLWRAPDFIGTRYTTSDDIDYQLNSLGRISGKSPFDFAAKLAADQGRLATYPAATAFAAVSGIKDKHAFDAINLASFLVASTVAALLICWFFGFPFAIVFAIFFWGLWPQLWHHSPPSAYPVVPWVPIIAFGAFAFLLNRFFATPHSSFLWLAGAAYLVSLAFYELYWLLFPPLGVALALALCNRAQCTTRQKILAGVAVVALPALYVLLNVLYKETGTGAYDGTTLANVNLIRIVATVAQFSIGSMSLFYLVRGKYEIYFFDTLNSTKINLLPSFSLLDLLRSAPVSTWLIAFLATIVALYFVRALARSSLSTMAFGLALGVGTFIAIGSVLPYAVTVKYQTWAAGEHPVYLGSRYSYFGLVIVAVALLGLAFRFIEQRTALALRNSAYVLLGLATLLSFVATSVFNERVAGTMRINNAKWTALGAAVHCEPVLKAMTGRTVAAPELWNRVWYAGIRSDSYWSRYSERVLGQPLSLRRIEAPQVAAEEVWFGYRTDRDGKLLAIFLATEDDADNAARLLVLTPRGTEVSLTIGSRAEHEHFHLGAGRGGTSVCGDYVLSSLTSRAIQSDALHFATWQRAQLGASKAQ